MPKTRYFYDDAPEHGITAAQIKRLGRARQVACMLNWFGRNYEDPAEETPYQSAEGGYQYVNGGPYDAREALDDEFSSFVSEAAIEEAVSEIESDGLTDWAPGPEHPNNQREDEDYPQDDEEPPPAPDLDDLIGQLEAGARTEFGSPYEQGERQELLRRLNRMGALLQAALPPAHGGIGHNRYETEAGDRPDCQLVCAALGASAKIRAELQKPVPDALVVAKEASFLKKLAAGIVIAAVGGVIGHVVDQIVDRTSRTFRRSRGGRNASRPLGLGRSGAALLIYSASWGCRGVADLYGCTSIALARWRAWAMSKLVCIRGSILISTRNDFPKRVAMSGRRPLCSSRRRWAPKATPKASATLRTVSARTSTTSCFSSAGVHRVLHLQHRDLLTVVRLSQVDDRPFLIEGATSGSDLDPKRPAAGSQKRTGPPPGPTNVCFLEQS